MDSGSQGGGTPFALTAQTPHQHPGHAAVGAVHPPGMLTPDHNIQVAQTLWRVGYPSGAGLAGGLPQQPYTATSMEGGRAEQPKAGVNRPKKREMQFFARSTPSQWLRSKKLQAHFPPTKKKLCKRSGVNTL